MQVTALPCRSTRAGTELELLILSADSHTGIGIDVASGALVRFLCDGDGPELPVPYSVVVGTLADPRQLVFDPAQPEAVALDGELRPGRRLSAWRVGRYLRSLLHPPGRQLLGWAGPAVVYWTLDGLQPSAALVNLADDPVALVGSGDLGGPGQLRCRFGWDGATLELPLTDRRVAASLSRTDRPSLRGPALARAVGGRPRYLVVALSPPVEGHCYKVVAGILPRP